MSALDVLYRDSVTVFNRLRVSNSLVWIPHYLEHVHFTTGMAAMVNTYGNSESDNAMLNIMYKGGRTSPVVNGLVYYKPKDFESLELETALKGITFQYGDEYGFIIKGSYDGTVESDGTIHDSDYSKTGGFFSYINRNYDDAFAINGVTQYDLIPHFSITAR